VRHPVDRLHSAYRFARTGGTSKMGIKNPQLYQSKSFSSFNRFVCEWLQFQNMHEISQLLGRNLVLGHYNKSQDLSFLVESTETLPIIEKIYKKDFEIFCYSVARPR
jgi:hypothetical protein